MGGLGFLTLLARGHPCPLTRRFGKPSATLAIDWSIRGREIRQLAMRPRHQVAAAANCGAPRLATRCTEARHGSRQNGFCLPFGAAGHCGLAVLHDGSGTQGEAERAWMPAPWV